MKSLTMSLTVFSIFLGLFAFWYSSEAVEDPMTAVGAFKFNEGSVAPEFYIENLAGGRVKLKDFRGKVVLLDFWATW
jgi:thiol-disulfide isomerase/thioredoxin